MHRQTYFRNYEVNETAHAPTNTIAIRMKQVRPELNRLTTLQRQILKWIRLEGGGCLSVSRLFTSLYFTQSHPDPIALGERLSEAVEQLVRTGYAEVRNESSTNSKSPSLYDFGGLHRNLVLKGDLWVWKSGDCPEVALTDFGSHYAARMA